MQVGVDIECQRDSADLDSLARMVLAPSEALAWALLSEEDRVAAFFSVWTAKEAVVKAIGRRSEEHTSELQSLMRISYAVFCLKKKKKKYKNKTTQTRLNK